MVELVVVSLSIWKAYPVEPNLGYRVSRVATAPSVDRTAREQLLKLPRLLKDKPPPYLAAQMKPPRRKLNGFTLDTATFRSRVQEIQVPRERLAGVVC